MHREREREREREEKGEERAFGWWSEQPNQLNK